MTEFKVGDKVRARPHAKPESVRGCVGLVTELVPCGGQQVACVHFPDCGFTSLGMFVGDGDLYSDEIELVNPLKEALTAGVEEAAREMLLPTDPKERKALPITTGVLDYFPLALAYLSKISKQGNDQHNPGQPLHWDKTKSKDHADCIARHLIDRGTYDTSDSPPLRHSGKLAWRALALLETELGNGTEP